VIGEFKNIFNTDQTLSVATNNAAVVVPTDRRVVWCRRFPATRQGLRPTLDSSNVNFSWGSASGFKWVLELGVPCILSYAA